MSGVRIDRVALFALLTTMPMSTSLLGAQECSPKTVRAAIAGLRSLAAPEAVYVEDAAADGSVLLPPPTYKINPKVMPILRCPELAGPKLIACLDDTRPTHIECRTQRTGYEAQVVPLGFVCLDLLLIIAQPPTLFGDDPCEDDGLGACVHEGFYFRPDDYTRTGNRFTALPIVNNVKEGWNSLLASGRLSFGYPSWLRGQE
jgi:hypothetical protein